MFSTLYPVGTLWSNFQKHSKYAQHCNCWIHWSHMTGNIQNVLNIWPLGIFWSHNRAYLKYIQHLITGHILVICCLFSQCVQHVSTGYLGPCPQCVGDPPSDGPHLCQPVWLLTSCPPLLSLISSLTNTLPVWLGTSGRRAVVGLTKIIESPSDRVTMHDHHSFITMRYAHVWPYEVEIPTPYYHVASLLPCIVSLVSIPSVPL